MAHKLASVFEGWEGFNRSLVSAFAPLNQEQLAFRAAAEMRSVGEIALHIADGRVDWFRRMSAPGSAELQAKIESRSAAPSEAGEICAWLDDTWRMIETTLSQWTVDDLAITYNHPYQGKVYAVSRQWTIWRIMAHDIYHGGHLTEPPVVAPASSR